MANNKIKCKKCRKSFDPELYSGLCPKCGAYSGRRMDTSALEHYIGAGELGEKEHRELHEKYDQGYDAAHPKYDKSTADYDYGEKAALLQEAREQFAKRQAKQETLLNGRSINKSPLSKLIKALVITVIIMVIMTVIMVLYTNIALMGKADENVIEVILPVKPGRVIFEHALLNDPIEVTVKSAGIAEEIEGLSGKAIYVAAAAGGSEEYNFDAKMQDVFLQYEFEGNIYYEMPMSSYNLKEFCKKYNIWEEDVLSGYDIGGTSFDEGYLFFIVDSESTDHKLLLQLSQYEDPAIVLQEALIDLDELPEPDLNVGEVE